MKASQRILKQREKFRQEVMQTNPSKENTRQVLLDILKSKLPKGTKKITVVSNGGAGASAMQFEKAAVSLFPKGSRIFSIECDKQKIAETDDRLEYLNDKYPESKFQILHGNNGSLDRIRGLDLKDGWTLLWADGLSRFGKQPINWMKQVKKLLKNEMRYSKLSGPRYLCLTLALMGQGPENPYHLLRRALRPYKKWIKDAAGTDVAENVIHGVHAYFNSLLASAKVHLEPLHAELYRGEGSKTHMVFMVWQVQPGKFKGQMFDRIVNRILENMYKTGYQYMVREKTARKSKSKQTPKAYDRKVLAELVNVKLKGFGVKHMKRKDLLTSNWMPACKPEEFINQCRSVYEQEAPCIM